MVLARLACVHSAAGSVGWLPPHSTALNFFVWDISPCHGVGESVVFQEKKESFVTAASGAFIAQHLGSVLQNEGME